MNLSGKTIYIVKVDNDIIFKTLNEKVAIETANDYNFEIIKGIAKAKVYKATIK